ncbi:hypothetical protein H2O64_17840 [Kordia sp. YSTF-M3]|uniref:PH domain-containing protein n=1 Tax=Kordia aestuariivivens TaxID=2759037 RepID=A0ABR7QD94_9FLAO|nr:STM3941 family protein [Kordia aestuariivivens]MBC8756539.1 hypothetical protein [Kordia aestuariivivens]
MKAPLLFYKDKKFRRKQIMLSMLIMVSSGFTIYFAPTMTVRIIFGLFFIVGSFIFYSFTANKPTVIVNDEGIRSTTNGMGIIAWKYITGFEIKKGINFKAIVITINDEDDFFKDKSNLAKGLMKTNIKRFGSPVIIPESEFNVSMLEAIEMIEAYT